jgi:hypothetical protein
MDAIRFEGYSDDLVHVHINSHREEVSTSELPGGNRGAYQGELRVRLANDPTRDIVVHVLYGPGGVWTFAPAPLQGTGDDDLDEVGVPLGRVSTQGRHTYSTQLQLAADVNSIEVLVESGDDSTLVLNDDGDSEMLA